ncbi:hypothetical protein KIL84_007330 [Mauremys mutica]|uniref:Uncharacterized protein n=1 Tax=Mauremys mutica TaxID=74926 RepID=A0A9D3X140_9SAUR|nr:hypothetical protein KIL84_007330 [Mauremys mutica]
MHDSCHSCGIYCTSAATAAWVRAWVRLCASLSHLNPFIVLVVQPNSFSSFNVNNLPKCCGDGDRQRMLLAVLSHNSAHRWPYGDGHSPQTRADMQLISS